MIVQKTDAALRPAADALWQTVFEDSLGEIDRLCAALNLDQHRFTIETQGQLHAMSHWYTAGTLSLPEGNRLPAGVLYAVATAPEVRGHGLGTEVAQAAWADMALQGNGARLVVPANAGLFRYYQRILPAQNAFYVQELTLTGKDCGVRPRQMDAAEYNIFREAYLKDRPHLVFSDAAMRLQQAICEDTGGGLFAFAGGCFSLEYTQHGALISELLCANQFVGLAAVSSCASGRVFTVRLPVQDMNAPGVRPFAMADLDLTPYAQPAWFGFAFE